ncbi:hypothetical protein GW17_00059285 [Ensete ventricosum]|nr:hypothetical protein GW17_00059285 [Ensete ventricosum]
MERHKETLNRRITQPPLPPLARLPSAADGRSSTSAVHRAGPGPVRRLRLRRGTAAGSETGGGCGSSTTGVVGLLLPGYQPLPWSMDITEVEVEVEVDADARSCMAERLVTVAFPLLIIRFHLRLF